jgi:hypothetical protein
VLGADYLIQKIETNPQLQEVPNLTALLHETYKYKAYPDAPVKLIQTKPRKGAFCVVLVRSHHFQNFVYHIYIGV